MKVGWSHVSGALMWAWISRLLLAMLSRSAAHAWGYLGRARDGSWEGLNGCYIALASTA